MADRARLGSLLHPCPPLQTACFSVLIDSANESHGLSRDCSGLGMLLIALQTVVCTAAYKRGPHTCATQSRIGTEEEVGWGVWTRGGGV